MLLVVQNWFQERLGNIFKGNIRLESANRASTFIYSDVALCFISSLNFNIGAR